ncbi:MAG: ferredoxin [Planctomycetota bacterium]
MRDLRRWHLGSLAAADLPAGAGAALATPAAPASAAAPDLLPLLLAPFRDATRVRHDFPLVLRLEGERVQASALADALAQWAQRASAQARVLQDNLPRIERRVRLHLAQAPFAAARDAVSAAATQMLAELQLRDSIASGVQADLDAILGQLEGVTLLPLDATTTVRLLQATASARVRAARARLASRVETAAASLRALLRVEAEKDPAARSAEALGKSLGAASGRFFDPGALARTVGQHRGTQRTDPERLERLQGALEALEVYLAASAPPELVVVHDGTAPPIAGSSVTGSSFVGVEFQHSDDACRTVADVFDAHTTPLLATLRALQVAELEGQGAYEPARHDPLLATLAWGDLGADDLHVLPVVVLLLPAATLAHRDLQALTRLVVSGRPVQVVAMQDPAGDPAHPGDADAPHARLELGYLGVAFRDAYVQQATAARPTHLLAGFQRALAGTRPGLHVVDSGLLVDGGEPPLGAFLHAGAAIEGRAHPLFQYDPEAGDTWAKRLDFAGNPAPETDWPTSTARPTDGATNQDAEPLTFTFADYALLQPRLYSAFVHLAEGLATDDLVPLAAYLALPPDSARRRVPFVSAVDRDGKRHRLAVRRSLVHVCRDRLRFWRTLQELAGVRNEHVREAVQRAREDAAAQATREREALAAKHLEELEQVRAAAAGDAMQGLARMLLELDPLPEGASVVPVPKALPASVPARPESAPATSPAPTVVEATAASSTAASSTVESTSEDDDASEEPWIDSPRCSTCNDCVNLNPLLFVYNENKQARIGDPRKGTYAQLVLAAEKCPSRCIHPGKPLDPNEADLETLMARAAPFNR